MDMIEPKELFVERMKKLLPDNEDYEKYMKIIREEARNFIRCNKIKISPDELKKRLEDKGWKILQKYKENPEIMLIENELQPGELGKSIEHLLGLYYVQEVSSMMSAIALKPEKEEIILDLCAAPGSKTTQIVSEMKNEGTIIANDKDLGRIRILASNLEKAGASNAIITQQDAVQLCEKLKKLGMKFDKILVDVPCSGEGNIRSNPKTLLMWNIEMIKKLGRLQKKIAASVIDLLKEHGEVVYSTCTHAPEENESVVTFLAENFNMEIVPVKLPLKCRPGLKKWKDETFTAGIENCCRIWPQDNDSEGFFVAKLRRRDYDNRV